MTPITIGDMAARLSTQLEMTRAKVEAKTLSEELTTGRTSDIRGKEQGDFTRYGALVRSIEITDRFRAANADAAFWLDTAQTALEAVQSSVARSASQLLISAEDASGVSFDAASTSAKLELEAVISALNVRVGGTAVFGGAETQATPLRDAETLLSSLSGAIAGSPTVEDALLAIDAWFSDPASGFDAVMYNGSVSSTVRLPVSDSSTLSFEIKANDSAVKDTLKALAIAALAADPVFSGDREAQTLMVRTAAEQVLAGEVGFAELRGNIGVLQERAEVEEVRLEAARFGYQLALNDIEAVDPYETAAKLEAVTTQLETLYAVTARLSELTLARYL